MVRTQTENGIEIRNYVNSRNVASCLGRTSGRADGAYVNANTFANCSSNQIACNNIFYIKAGKVIEYAPTGRCYTDETVRPEARYERLKAQ